MECREKQENLDGNYSCVKAKFTLTNLFPLLVVILLLEEYMLQLHNSHEIVECEY